MSRLAEWAARELPAVAGSRPTTPTRSSSSARRASTNVSPRATSAALLGSARGTRRARRVAAQPSRRRRANATRKTDARARGLGVLRHEAAGGRAARRGLARGRARISAAQPSRGRARAGLRVGLARHGRASPGVRIRAGRATEGGHALLLRHSTREPSWLAGRRGMRATEAGEAARAASLLELYEARRDCARLATRSRSTPRATRAPSSSRRVRVALHGGHGLPSRRGFKPSRRGRVVRVGHAFARAALRGGASRAPALATRATLVRVARGGRRVDRRLEHGLALPRGRARAAALGRRAELRPSRRRVARRLGRRRGRLRRMSEGDKRDRRRVAVRLGGGRGYDVEIGAGLLSELGAVARARLRIEGAARRARLERARVRALRRARRRVSARGRFRGVALADGRRRALQDLSHGRACARVSVRVED
jgi:hypothetical protein